jgi:hypothetical protein
MKFFDADGISRNFISAIFILKILAGTVLWTLYTYHYTYRSVSDIYKYFDDSKLMFDALAQNPFDYLRMLTGIGDGSPAIDSSYYSKMNHWHMRFESGFSSDAHAIIRFNAFVRVFSFGNYHVHTVFMCFLSTAGLIALYKTFSGFFQDRKKEHAAAIFLVPSVVFWGSGVLKEGLVIFAMGALLLGWKKIIEREISLRHVFAFAAGGFLLIIVKFYILVSLIPGMLGWLWVSRTGKKFIPLKYIAVLCAFIIAATNLHRFLPGYNTLEILVKKRQDFVKLTHAGTYLVNEKGIAFIALGNERMIKKISEKKFRIKEGSSYLYWQTNALHDTMKISHSTDTSSFEVLWYFPKTGSTIETGDLQAELLSIIANCPQALSNVFFRPHIAEVYSPLLLFAAAENLLLLLLGVTALLFIKKPSRVDANLLFFCLSFVLIIFLLIGLTTPVMGSVVRYKVPALPFLLMAFLSIFDKEKFRAKFPSLRKFFP